ncbi:hypothetical protein Hdeb2414_s0001g00030011 [Helianthus debilis subsp. tardiflorus]
MSGTEYYLILKEHCHFNFVTCFRITKKPLEGFHVIVDAGNGVGGFFAVSFF